MVTNFRNKNYRIAIAIDFGTARSGHAYLFFEDRNANEPHFRNKWTDTNEFYPKTLTEILFRPDGSVEGWGHSAKKRFSHLREVGEEKGYIFIDNFKTLLHEGEDRDDNGPYITKEGKRFYVQYLITEFLRLIKEVALQDIALGLGGKGLLDEKEIRWCLTVPAVWKDDSKQLMRRAAQMAGLIGEGSEEEERLLLVLEPEAAAVHCQQVMLKQNESSSIAGKVIMIVDAGGGTVDVTVHEVVKDKGLDELIPSGGGLHGSKYVDQSFREFLDRKLSPEAMDEFETECSVEYTNLIRGTWESIKCGYNIDSKWRTSIDIPRKLEKILKDKYPQILEQLANAQDGDDMVIQLINEDMERIFKPTVDQLIDKVRDQFTALKNHQCDILFLVGGFAESPLLQKRIQEEFSSKVKKIIVPERPGAAVLLGAASYGVNPGTIIARRSRLTYGKGCIAPFENGRDPEERRIPKKLMREIFGENEDCDYCLGRFDIFVATGDRVPNDAVVVRRYQIPLNQTEIEATFLSTPNPKVRYVDEEGVSEIASLELRLPFAPQNNAVKCIDLEMHFGLSEVVAYAIDPISDNRERCNFRFSSSH